MEKVEIWEYFLSYWGYLDFVFIEMIIERSIVCLLWILSKSLNVIGCQGKIKGKFSIDIQKSSSLKP